MALSTTELSRHEVWFTQGWSTSVAPPDSTEFQLVLDTYNMSYSNRTITVHYKLYASRGTGNAGSQELNNLTVQLHPAATKTSEPYTDVTVCNLSGVFVNGTASKLVSEGNLTIPYKDEVSTMYLYWSISGTDSFGVKYSFTTTTYSSTNKALRSLDSFPFVVEFPEEDFGVNTDYYEDTRQRYGIYNTTVGDFAIVIPKAGYAKYTYTIIGHSGTIWETSINNPPEGRYTGTFKIDAAGAKALKDSMRDSGTLKTYHISTTQHTVVDELGAATSRTGALTIMVSSTTPIVSGLVEDTNAVAVALTGDSGTMIRFFSNIQATILAETQGGASIVETGITNGGVTIKDTETYNFYRSGDNVFHFYALDDRGETGYATIVMPVIEYIAPTSKVTTSVITGNGDANVKVAGAYFAQDIGTVANELAVYYRYKLQYADDSEFTDWIQLSALEIDAETNTYVATGFVDGLNYSSTYIFQAYTKDLLCTTYSADYIAASIPVFDWSATDFNFNVPVNINGALTINGVPVNAQEEETPEDDSQNNVLWEGVQVMAGNTSIRLADTISNQKTGIVLIFTTGGVSGGEDSGVNYAFIPKIVVSLLPDTHHNFTMINNNIFGYAGAKSLMFTDNSIIGHMANDSIGTGSNSKIVYDNAKFTLRYVIGV